MSRHTATIDWRAGPGGFRRGRFSRVHAWSFDGGMRLSASASPAVVPAPYSDPRAVDPEEAFVAALASCHMMSFLYLANQAGVEVSEYTDTAVGELTGDRDGRRAITRVTLRPRVVYGDPAPAPSRERELHAQAHQECYIANSVLTEVIVDPVV